MIKFFDIKKQDRKIFNLIIKDIKKICINNDFILGSKVIDFEKKFSNFCKSKYAISCANGTDSLTIALKSLNLPTSSEVIIPAMTYCSTAFAVLNANLIPVLVDIDFLKPTISVSNIKKKISTKTKVIMPVHLYGSVCDMSKIKKIVKNKNIYIIDDCSQAHGASYKRKKVGSLADISCFSLYPGKNLGAYGDAGVITTNSKKFYKKIKNYRNLGSDIKFKHTQIGVNSRLDTIQAAVLIRKLANLTKLNNKRKAIGRIYNKNINNKKIIKLNYSNGAVYHQYVILCKNRNKLIDRLKNNNIEYNFHYPKSINQLDSLKKFFKKKKYQNSEKIASDGLSLPIDPNLKKSDINKIIKVLNSF